MKRIKCLALACLLALALLVGCSSSDYDAAYDYETTSQDENLTGDYSATPGLVQHPVMVHDVTLRNENLARLGKVWGFAKYTHDGFISGRLDWDAELINLIPLVYDAEDVNGILYDWFVGLGEDGYGFEFGHDFDILSFFIMVAEVLALGEELTEFEMTMPYMADFLTELDEFASYFGTMLEDGVHPDWGAFVATLEENFPFMWGIVLPALAARDDGAGRPVADLSWINYEYLGPLSAHLLRFDGVSAMDRSASPVFFEPGTGFVNFSNQSHHPHMDFSDSRYRLLGLFRFWNALNYFFPYLDVLDVEWNEILLEYIPVMLGGTDRLSYELTLARMAHHLHDAHIVFNGTTFFEDTFGRYVVPVQLIAAEGRLVVYETSGRNNSLARGDVILGINNRDIDEVIAEMRRYLSYPNEDKFLAFLAGVLCSVFPVIEMGEHHALRSHVSDVAIDVLRNGVEMTLNIEGVAGEVRFPRHITRSYVILDNNIGIINPSVYGNVRLRMDRLENTDGIIIDLRQVPSTTDFIHEMRQYLMEVTPPFAYASRPSQTHLGMRYDNLHNLDFPRDTRAFIYDMPVVLLMDERTFHRAEFAIMAFREAPNVTVMGQHSTGSFILAKTELPLPGGIDMRFTSLGTYTLDGGQIFRYGLAPDIRVDRTIQGITEGRDELIEAAIGYIVGRVP